MRKNASKRIGASLLISTMLFATACSNGTGDAITASDTTAVGTETTEVTEVSEVTTETTEVTEVSEVTTEATTEEVYEGLKKNSGEICMNGHSEDAILAVKGQLDDEDIDASYGPYKIGVKLPVGFEVAENSIYESMGLSDWSDAKKGDVGIIYEWTYDDGEYWELADYEAVTDGSGWVTQESGSKDNKSGDTIKYQLVKGSGYYCSNFQMIKPVGDGKYIYITLYVPPIDGNTALEDFMANGLDLDTMLDYSEDCYFVFPE